MEDLEEDSPGPEVNLQKALEGGTSENCPSPEKTTRYQKVQQSRFCILPASLILRMLQTPFRPAS